MRLISGVSGRPYRDLLQRCDASRFQRLRPNVEGGAERGLGGRSSGVVVVRLVAGTALGFAGSRFGVSGGS
jgi:hypothetical protein